MKWYFVCTGNICRSAFGQAYLSHQFEALENEAKVTSGGTGINQALIPTPEIMELGARYGLTDKLAVHRPHAATAEVLNEQDVILTATQSHRSQILYLAPHLLHRVFTLREFAFLLQQIELPEHGSEQEFWQEIIQQMSKIRALAQTDGFNLDIVDPFCRSFSIYETCISEIIEATDHIVQVERIRLDKGLA